MSPRKLRLSLGPNDPLPADLCWRVQEGYIRASCREEGGSLITLGLWGPGDLVPSPHPHMAPIEHRGLSRVCIEECMPSSEELLEGLHDQIAQAASLLRINRLRPSDARLLQLLQWIGSRFGRVTRAGTTISLEEMNLTHQTLADICGMTRVTVTKALTRFKAGGQVVPVDPMTLLVPGITWNPPPC